MHSLSTETHAKAEPSSTHEYLHIYICGFTEQWVSKQVSSLLSTLRFAYRVIKMVAVMEQKLIGTLKRTLL